MKKRMFKILALILSAALLVTGTFYFTLAYLQAKSEAVVNTFTAGKINLTLKESEVDQYGNIKYYAESSFTDGVLNEDAVGYTEYDEGYNKDIHTQVNKVEKNTYKLVPGQTYTKNPVVTVAEGSEECYLYLAVYNGLISEPENGKTLEIQNGSTIEAQLIDNGWKVLYVVDSEGNKLDENGNKVSEENVKKDAKKATLNSSGYTDEEKEAGGIAEWYGETMEQDLWVTVYYYTGTSDSQQAATFVPALGTPIDTFESFTIDSSCGEAEFLDLGVSDDESFMYSICALAFAVQTTGFKNVGENVQNVHTEYTVYNAWKSTFGFTASEQGGN